MTPTELATNLVATSVCRTGLRAAHEAAAAYHEAIARAMECAAEIAAAEADESLDDDSVDYWQEQETKALGEATTALLRMPIKWAEMLRDAK